MTSLKPKTNFWFSVFSIVHECGHSAPKFLHSRYYTVYVTVALDIQ